MEKVENSELRDKFQMNNKHKIKDT